MNENAVSLVVFIKAGCGVIRYCSVCFAGLSGVGFGGKSDKKRPRVIWLPSGHLASTQYAKPDPFGCFPLAVLICYGSLCFGFFLQSSA